MRISEEVVKQRAEVKAEAERIFPDANKSFMDRSGDVELRYSDGRRGSLHCGPWRLLLLSAYNVSAHRRVTIKEGDDSWKTKLAEKVAELQSLEDEHRERVRSQIRKAALKQEKIKQEQEVFDGLFAVERHEAITRQPLVDKSIVIDWIKYTPEQKARLLTQIQGLLTEFDEENQ
jgi:hypothetical protein